MSRIHPVSKREKRQAVRIKQKASLSDPRHCLRVYARLLYSIIQLKKERGAIRLKKESHPTIVYASCSIEGKEKKKEEEYDREAVRLRKRERSSGRGRRTLNSGPRRPHRNPFLEAGGPAKKKRNEQKVGRSTSRYTFQRPFSFRVLGRRRRRDSARVRRGRSKRYRYSRSFARSLALESTPACPFAHVCLSFERSSAENSISQSEREITKR